jgi:hypothetical protein
LASRRAEKQDIRERLLSGNAAGRLRASMGIG